MRRTGAGVSLGFLDCILRELEAPDYVVVTMCSTRALDRRQSAE